MKHKRKQILLIGGCGMGVGPLGVFLSQMGHEVYSYDDYPDARIEKRLEAQGIQILRHLHGKKDFDEVVVTRAIQYTPERLKRFKNRYPKAKIWFRGDFLASIANRFKSIVIAGTHGKTSTTALIIGMLKAQNFPCSYVMGGFFGESAVAPAYYDERSPWLVLEVDESDGTIEKFRPTVSAITNVELDHVDYYGSEKALLKIFRKLVSKTKSKTFLGAKAAEALGISSEKKSKSKVVLPSEAAGIALDENKRIARTLVEWLTEKPIAEEKVEPLQVERRQQCEQIGVNGWVISDYAHHPSELAALSDWVAARFPGAAVHWVFQPHRYSRTIALKEGFVKELASLEATLIPEYGAFEKYDKEGSSFALHEALLKAGANSEYCRTPFELRDSLVHSDENGIGDSPVVYVFAGAGDILMWKDWMVHLLSSDHYDFGAHSSHLDDELWLGFHRDHLEESKSYVACHEPLRKKTTLNVGGNARYYVEPTDLQQLQWVLKAAKMFRKPVHLLGKGSNTLISDSEIDGVVVRLNRDNWNQCEYLGEGQFWVGAGLSLKRFCKAAMNEGIGGFNFMEGIPGTVGGAVCMNAGAMGSEIRDRLVEVECLDFDGKRVRLTRDEMGFSYRHCAGVENRIVLNVLFQGNVKQDIQVLEAERDRFREKRLASQPAEPSAGCMFKNPSGDAAGRLIDAAGLKGFCIGGARVSEKHANFLVTSKGASSGDVLAVTEHVKAVVKDQFGVELEQEIKVFPRYDTLDALREG